MSAMSNFTPLQRRKVAQHGDASQAVHAASV
jgi:hypothetical protein